MLISYRCDVNTCDDEGRTPLRVVAMFNQPAILKALIERGASHMIKDKSNNTAIDYSKQKVHVGCVYYCCLLWCCIFCPPETL